MGVAQAGASDCKHSNLCSRQSAYGAFHADGVERDYNDRVDLAYTACNFGKVRPWFVCPHCYQRKAKLYMRRGYFACRHCHKVAYNSQSQDAIDRTWAVQYKIEARIGEKHKRPKGMHHKTFEALRAKLYQCLWLRDMAIDARMAQLGGLLEQIEARMSVCISNQTSHRS